MAVGVNWEFFFEGASRVPLKGLGVGSADLYESYMAFYKFGAVLWVSS